MFDNPTLAKIGETHGKSVDVFDFTLSDEEMAAVTALDTKTSLFFRHDTPEAVDMFVGFIKERAGRE